MKTQRTRSAPGGFTIVELLVALAILGVLMLLGVPTLLDLIHRGRMEGLTRETAVLMQQARLEAIKRNRSAVVLADLVAGEMVAFVDDGTDPPNRSLDPGERILGRLSLPAGITLSAPGGLPAIDGFTAADGPVYQPNGSALETGALRFGDPRGNFLELRIDPPATAHLQVRKFEQGGWYAPGEGGVVWEWR